MHDLLTSPLVPAVRAGERAAHSLPEIYAALICDDVDSFPGLAAHQAQAWYQFLAQLGAIALHRAGRGAPPAEAGEWRDLIAALTPGCAATAWSLVVSDPSQPAFLQPPTRRFEDFKEFAAAPDRIDVPVTAKNHDRKHAVAIDSAPHHWLYSLLNLQTTQGYSGKTLYGIARMNGAYSNKPMVERRPGPRWGQRTRRAIRMLLDRREDVLKRAGDDLFRAEGGIVLCWLERWDDDDQILPDELDPYFIEICRRIRLVEDQRGRVRARCRLSKRPRTGAKALNGNMADPWVPIDLAKKDAPALTVAARGFDYRLVQKILFRRKEYRLPLALKELPDEHGANAEIHMIALVRGQGKTEGLHERTIPLPCRIAERIAAEPDEDDDDDRRSLATLSESMVKVAGGASETLKRAVRIYFQKPGDSKSRRTRGRPDAAAVAIGRYDRVIDDRFFDCLFGAELTEAGFRAAEERWQIFLRAEAVKIARKVWAGAAAPSARREKARAESESALYGGLRRRLPAAFPPGRRAEDEAA